MSYLDTGLPVGFDGSMETAESREALESRLQALNDRLREMPSTKEGRHDRASIQLEVARTLVALDKKDEAWNLAREAFDTFLAGEDWEKAVEACDVLFLTEQEGSLSALGQGVWLGVTFPIDPELSVAMLQHIVDETPDDADGAAVAAATAVYITDLRAEGKQKENLGFFTNQMLGRVAKRHSGVEDEEQFRFWVERLELSDPDKFLVRLRNVIDVLVQDDWWFDRDRIRESLPVN